MKGGGTGSAVGSETAELAATPKVATATRVLSRPASSTSFATALTLNLSNTFTADTVRNACGVTAVIVAYLFVHGGNSGNSGDGGNDASSTDSSYSSSSSFPSFSSFSSFDPAASMNHTLAVLQNIAYYGSFAALAVTLLAALLTKYLSNRQQQQQQQQQQQPYNAGAAAGGLFKVCIPEGITEGQPFLVDIGGGQQVTVICPGGSPAGHEIHIKVNINMSHMSPGHREEREEMEHVLLPPGDSSTSTAGTPHLPHLPQSLRNLGTSPLRVSQVGYGAWPLSYDERPPEAEAIAVLHQALDMGVRFIDTSDAYCIEEGEKHHNERLIRKALDSYPDQTAAKQVVVATKGICVRPGGRWERVATPAQIAKAIRGSHEVCY